MRESYGSGTNTLTVESRLDGTHSYKVSIPWASSTGQLKIKASSGSIAFYENGILRYAEPFQLPSNNCYIYAYTSSTADYPGTDAFDNYSLNPTQLYNDDFKYGTFNGWEIDRGSWNVQNQWLQSTANDSYIYSNSTYSSRKVHNTKIDSKSRPPTNALMMFILIQQKQIWKTT